jgi:hypothetical protein
MRLQSLSLLAAAAILCLSSLAGAAGPNPKALVDASKFYKAGSPTAGLQDAVDALPKEGGVVYIPAGVYEITRSVILRSGVRVRGEGEQTVIARRDPCIQVALAADAKKGERKVTLKDTKGLAAGKEVCVFSTESYGWYCTHAIVVSIKDGVVGLDRELTHDYLLKEEAGLNNFFPAFYALEQKEIRIEDLVIDGRMEKGAGFKNDFTLSAVHFRDVKDVLIARVHVKSFPGDGISMQVGDNVTVTECISERNLGHGFHPGTGITSGSWTNNVGRYNGWDGLYFCHRVRHSTMSGNRFHDNGWNGMGGLGEGGEGGDRYNVISGNFCWNNAKSGIECVRGGNNTIVNNVCENNSRGEPGRWPGILVEDTFNSIISGNRCLDFQAPDSARTQAWGILVIGKSRDNVITGNILSGNKLGSIGGDALGNNLLDSNESLPVHEPVGM